MASPPRPFRFCAFPLLALLVAISANARSSVTVDDLEMEFIGKWHPASHGDALGGLRFSHDNNANKGGTHARFVPQLRAEGLYHVYLHYIPAPSRSSAVPIIIRSADGEHYYEADQTGATIPGTSQFIATLPFKAGTGGWLIVSNTGTEKSVAVDVVTFEPAEARAEGGLREKARPGALALDYERLPWRNRLIGMKGQPDETDLGQPLFPAITRYGQWKHREWPGKIRSDEDLLVRRAAEEVSLNTYPGPDDWNKYGGWAAGPSLAATGFFRTEKFEGRWWLVDPEGRLFFSHGVNCVRKMDPTPVARREAMFEGTPWAEPGLAPFVVTNVRASKYDYAGTSPRSFNFTWANLRRKYGEHWDGLSAETAHRRLRSWGFNTIGNWSEETVCRQRRTPYTVNLGATGMPLQGSPRGFRDVYDSTFARNLAKRVRQEAGRSLDDPWCLGYFVDNELPWGAEHTLGEWTLRSPPHQPAKIAMLDGLKRRYATINDLNAAWGTAHGSWAALQASTQAPATSGARRDQEAFHRQFAERYFKTVRDVLKQNAPHQLYLGCRFHTRNQAAREAAAMYCDILSYNIYGSDPTASVSDLGVPVIFSEFGVGAVDRGHFYGGIHAVATQAERADYHRAYTDRAVGRADVVGVHWFQFSDQPVSGRTLEGENGQYGLVDIADTPYPDLIDATRRFGTGIYRRLRAPQSPSTQPIHRP